MYVNREAAGNRLGKALKKYQLDQPLLLGIPRGGIEVAYYAARHLQSDFDAIIVRKLGYLQQPEAAFGALAEDGSLYLDPWSDIYLNKEIIQEVIKEERKEIQRRVQRYRLGKELPPLTDRVIVLVDDGIATRATIFAAIMMCKKQSPKKLVVAAPVSGYDRLSKLEREVDEVVIPEKRERFIAVSQAYRDFSNLSDDDVVNFMDLWRKNALQKASHQK